MKTRKNLVDMTLTQGARQEGEREEALLTGTIINKDMKRIASVGDELFILKNGNVHILECLQRQMQESQLYLENSLYRINSITVENPGSGGGKDTYITLEFVDYILYTKRLATVNDVNLLFMQMDKELIVRVTREYETQEGESIL